MSDHQESSIPTLQTNSKPAILYLSVRYGLVLGMVISSLLLAFFTSVLEPTILFAQPVANHNVQIAQFLHPPILWNSKVELRV